MMTQEADQLIQEVYRQKRTPEKERMMSKRIAVFLAALGLAMGTVGVPSASAQSEVDALLNKLVEKGVLSVSEAQEVRNEMAGEAKTRTKARQAEIEQVARKSVLPKWVQSTKWFGDLRLRFESQIRNNAKQRNRERVRLRFGFKTQPVDKLEVGVRLATGDAGDPVSTNQSLTDLFDSKPVRLDRAYAKFTPWEGVGLTAGKMANPFKVSPDLIWDGDITPEGAALQFESPREILPGVTPLANLAAFRIDELSGDVGDPGMLGAQGGARVAVPGTDWTWTPAVAYYDFTGVKGRTASSLPGAPAGNTTTAAGGFRDDFDILNFFSELKMPAPFKGLGIDFLNQPVTLFGDYTKNTAAADDDTAYQFGFTYGKAGKRFGDWRLIYAYKRFESDAAFGAIADSDFGGGGTNHRGHEFGLRFGLAKNWYAEATYIRAQDIDSTGSVNPRRGTLQLDTAVKW